MLSILIRKILSLMLILAAGWLLAKKGPLTEADSKSLSRLTVYLVMPCSIFSAFQMERSPEVLKNLGLVLAAALCIHLVYIGLTGLLRRPLRLDPVEQCSLIYTNAGNLIIPLVSAMLGPEWVIYTSAYILTMTVLTWSHGKSLLCGEAGADLKALGRNPNILALLAGVGLFLLNRQLPQLLRDTVSTVGSMVGPLSMLVTGMLLSTQSLRRVLTSGRIWLVTGLRLILYPLSALAVLGLLGLAVPSARECFLITMMAAAAPCAGLITNICQLYDRDSAYAGAICTLTTLMCALTIPLMVWLYTGLFL